MKRTRIALVEWLPTVVLLAGMAVSICTVLLMPDMYHEHDWKDMLSWAETLDEGLRGIYSNCERCNYPIVGLLVSAGLIHVLDSAGSVDTSLLFRLAIGLVDAANVLLLFLLLRGLGIRKSALWAGIIGLLPSSWAGGALWGQIDSYSQFFLLLALLLIVRLNTAARKSQKGRRVPMYFALLGMTLTCLLLTKQLAVFSLLVLEAIAVVNLYFVCRSLPKALAYSGLFLGWQAALLLLSDLLVHIESPYVSHLAYLWLTRSKHMDKITGNGFNIWIFLGWEQWASSREPFYHTFTPRSTGFGLFAAWMTTLSASLLVRLKRKYSKYRSRAFDKETLANILFFLALTNLCFNVFLSGTHERYLYHFYPLIVAATLGLRRHSTLFPRSMLAVLLFGGISYGLFVFEILSAQLPMAFFILKDARFQAAFHLFLLIYLSQTYLRYHGVFLARRSPSQAT